MTLRSPVRGLLFVSGATGLIYEVLWSRWVANVIGTSGEASAVVLATFMGGLALGAYLLGRVTDRSLRPLALYGVLELGVAASALAFPAVLHGCARLYFALAPRLSTGGQLGLRLLLSSASLLIPTVLMGGTLPALLKHFTRSLQDMRTELARLYGLNSLGACVGALVGGLWLIPSVGLTATLRAAVIVNVLLGLVALLLGRHRVVLGPPQGFEAEAPAEVEPAPSMRGLVSGYAGLALTGFAALLGETAFIRLLTLVLGGSPYAFTLIVAAYVLGIGLGSAWLSTRNARSDSLRLFGQVQLALVLAICLAVPLYARLPYLFWKVSFGLNHTVETWPLYQAVTFGTALLVVGLPTFLLGVAFPCGARAVSSRTEAMGRGLGSAYLWNTLGTVAGAGLGGLVLLPRLGLEGIFIVVLASHLLSAGLALGVGAAPSRGGVRSRAWMGIAGAAALLCVHVVAQRGWSTFVAGFGAFRLRDAPPPTFGETRREWFRRLVPLFHEDDAGASVVVLEEAGSTRRVLRINGKGDAGNGRDMGTQLLLGHVGMLLHPRDVKRALVVGLGSGVTAAAALSHPLERLDVVELSPAVTQAARLFDRENHAALDDPRLRLHREDAKTFLATADSKYDLVISEPSNPWTAGAAALFTRDFFRQAAAHMTEDGLIVQWCHTYENATPLIQLVIRTLRETFPYAVTWVGAHDVLFVASRTPFAPHWDELARRMRSPAVRADLLRAGVDDPLTFLSLQAQTNEGQQRFAGGGPINTDDLNQLEFSAPIAFYVDPPVTLPDERRTPTSTPLWVQGELATHLDAARARAVHGLLLRDFPPEAPLVFSVARLWQALSPGDDEAADAVARSAMARGDLGEAEQALRARVDAGGRAPRLMAAFFKVLALQAERRHSVFSRETVRPDAALMAWARASLKDQKEVQDALERLDHAP